MNYEALYQLWKNLDRPRSSSSWSAKTTSNPKIRIGKTSNDGIAFLVLRHPLVATDSTKLSTSHISYSPDVETQIETGDTTIQENFAVLKCDSPNPALQEHFIRIVCSVIPECSDNLETHFDTVVRQIFELFRNLSRPSTRTIQGLWGELLLIANASNPEYLAQAWHSNPNATHDFLSNEAHLEVKTTTRPLREHRFSLSQLEAATDITFISSLVVQDDDHGKSVLDLSEVAVSRVNSTDLKRRIQTIVSKSIGDQWEQVPTIRFNVAAALESLRTLRSLDIPRITCEIPPTIKEINFRVDLSNVPQINASTISSTPLLKAMHPSSSHRDSSNK